MAHNTLVHPQANILTDSLTPRLLEVYPDGQFAVCADVGIYWRHTPPDPLRGFKAPDWFLVPKVPPMLDGVFRRSYVMWQEVVRPLVVIEFVSGDGSEERDATPQSGKFWVYENAIGACYYAIYEVATPSIELYKNDDGRFVLVPANAHGRFPIPPLGVELGLREGTYRSLTVPWLRVWDSSTGKMLPLSEEIVALEKSRADAEKERADNANELLDDARERLQDEPERAENERKIAEEARKLRDAALAENQRLLDKLRAAGIDPAA